MNALGYLALTSAKNNLRWRLRQLRRPRYFVGALAVLAYFAYTFAIRLFLSSHSQSFQGLRGAPSSSGDAEALIALLVLLALLAAWVFPSDRAALRFTEAEVALLFPAPVTRRALIHYKLAKLQGPLLISSVVLMLFSSNFSIHGAWMRVLGACLVLNALTLHTIAASFVRTLLLDRGVTNWRRRLLVVGLLGAVVGSSWRSAQAISQLDWPKGFQEFRTFGLASVQAGAMPYVLLPFRVLARPYLAMNAGDFIRAAAPALAIVGALYAWILYADVAFEEASTHQAQALAERIARIRTGERRVRASEAREAIFQLRGPGWPFVALLWKNLIAAAENRSLVVWAAPLFVGLAVVLPALAGGITRAGTLAGICGYTLAIVVILGPGSFRYDLRRDIAAIDILKQYPVGGAQIVLGEVLAPVAVISVAVWALLGALLCLRPLMEESSRLMIDPWLCAAAAPALPAISLVLVVVRNAAVLVFPSWAEGISGAAPGLEALGQRLLMNVATFVVLALTLIPAVIFVAALVWAGGFFDSMHLAIVLAGAGGAAVLVAEAAFGIWLLGPQFEAFDISEEPSR